MLSKRNFAMIMMIFAIVLVLFLSTAILKEYFNDYDVNHAAAGERIPLDSAGQAIDPAQAAQHVIYIGSPNTGYYKPIQEWVSYRKMSYQETSDVLAGIGLSESYEKADTYLLLEGAVLDGNADAAAQLLDYVRSGGIVAFCSLPEYQTIQSSSELTYLLGVQRFRAQSVRLQEIRLYEGFLLGGEVHYSFDDAQDPERMDMLREIPWYDISSRTKTYMSAYVTQQDQVAQGATNEDMPAIIWRTSVGTGSVFAVNGNFMDGEAALGILDAMVYETRSYSLYPVVNAQNLCVTGFPDLTGENEEMFTAKYGFDSQQFQRDILWPSLVAAAQKGNWKITAFISSKLRRTTEAEADMEELIEYLKYFNEESAEAGIALGRKEDTDLFQSMKDELEKIDALHLTYGFSGGYIRRENENQLSKLWKPDGTADLFSGIRTVVGEPDSERGIFSLLTEQITRQSITLDGYRYTYQDDFLLKSLQTALGYSNVQADIYRIIWPESGSDSWETASNRLASHIDTYWKPFSVFDKTTITESDRRLRLFLNERVSSSASPLENGQRIGIQVENFGGEAWVMLRTHGEVLQSMEGGTWKQVEEGAYLLHLTSDTATVIIGSKDGTHYFSGNAA